MGSLAEDLLVLAVMAENAGVQSARRMPYVLRGAELIQLCIDGRITVTDGRIKVVNAKETGSPDLDAALASIAQRGQQPSADVWVREARDQIVRTLTAFLDALRQGQQIADSSRTAVERAMEKLPAPFTVSPTIAAVMSIETYPLNIARTSTCQGSSGWQTRCSSSTC